MDFRHEMVFPNDGLPFKMFVFEGKEGNYRVTKHWHRSVEIFLVLEGNIDFYINSEQIVLGQGQLILVNSNEVHSIDCPDPNFTLVLQIPRALFEQYLTGADTLVFYRSGEKDALLAASIEQMYEIYSSRPYGYMFGVLRDFYQIMYLLVSDYRIAEVDEERKLQNRNLERLSSITDYIRANYNENLTLEKVADRFGFSPAYLSRMFQKYAGINYKKYVQELRIEAGYRLLMNTARPVGEIAMECGFPDGRSFAKAFSRRYGMTPAQYRKTGRGPQ